MIKKIEELLKKYTTIKSTNRFVQDTCATVLNDILHTTVPNENIKVNKNNIYIQGSSSLKTEIMLHKSNILSHINKETSRFKQHITNIQ